MNQDAANGRSVAAVLADTKDELKHFIETRIALLKAEMREKIATLKIAAPLAVVGVVFLATAYLLLTSALVALVFVFLPDNAYRWCIALAAVGVLWAIIGGIAFYFAKREFELKGLMPTKTIRVLQGDKSWLQTEVKNQV